MKAMNKVILKGNVGQDPKITNFKDGGKVAQFSLATTERSHETKDGKKIEEKTEWHNILVRRTGLATVVEKYVKRGTPLLLEGKLQTRTYTDNYGQTRYITEVIVEEMEMLGGGNNKQGFAPVESDDLP